MSKNYGLRADELDDLVEFNSSPDNPEPLTAQELSDLADMKLTLGLMVKARRALALREQIDKGESKFVEKAQLAAYATRLEITPIEEAAEFNSQMVYALFAVLKRKRLVTEEDLVEALRDTSEAEVIWPDTAK